MALVERLRNEVDFFKSKKQRGYTVKKITLY